MSERDKAFTGSIPELYEKYLVPLIFESYASDLAERVAKDAPESVLEIAAGTGVVTRALTKLLDAESQFTVTDLNQAMLDHAATKQAPDARITWRQADALSLPFSDDSFDSVACQFGVMFFPDRVAGYAEAKRVLKPGGKLVFNVWDSIDQNVFAEVVTQSMAEAFPDNPPRFLERTPHGYFDLDEIRSDLLAGGLIKVEIETKSETSTAPSADHPAIAYCQGTPLRNEIEALDPAGLEAVTHQATAAIARICGSGPVAGKIQAHIVTAVS